MKIVKKAVKQRRVIRQSKHLHIRRPFEKKFDRFDLAIIGKDLLESKTFWSVDAYCSHPVEPTQRGSSPKYLDELIQSKDTKIGQMLNRFQNIKRDATRFLQALKDRPPSAYTAPPITVSDWIKKQKIQSIDAMALYMLLMLNEHENASPRSALARQFVADWIDYACPHNPDTLLDRFFEAVGIEAGSTRAQLERDLFAAHTHGRHVILATLTPHVPLEKLRKRDFQSDEKLIQNVEDQSTADNKHNRLPKRQQREAKAVFRFAKYYGYDLLDRRTARERLPRRRKLATYDPFFE